MLSLHQLTCFLATYEHGSLTAAAEELGYAQPSVSEQIRALEKSLGVELFRRVGRGVVPTTVADTLRPHAERVLAAVDEAQQSVRQVKSFETGTIRFGMFGTARLYAGASLVGDVLSRYPGVRVESSARQVVSGITSDASESRCAVIGLARWAGSALM